MKLLNSFFNPNSIAIIGASNNINKWGHVVTERLMECEYVGRVYPVNPREDYIFLPYLDMELECYKIDEIPKVDLALILIPSDIVIKVITELVEMNIKSYVVFSAGFSETLESDGIQKEQKLKKIIDEYNLNLLGPNTLGFINNDIDLNASIIPEVPRRGNISFVCQSGSMGLSISRRFKQEDIGIDMIVSMGNKLSIDDADIIEYLYNRNKTRDIIMHIEGVKNGRKFVDVLRNIRNSEIDKNIFCMKTGKTKVSSSAVQSHTGALAGEDIIYDGIFEQFKIKRLHKVKHIFGISKLLEYFDRKPYNGNRVGVFSCGGGAGIIVFDNLNLPPAEFSEETVEKIKEIIPKFGSANNPIDSAAASDYFTYYNSLKILDSDPNVDIILCIYVDGGFIELSEPQQAIVDFDRDCSKPIIYCQFANDDIDFIKDHKIPCFTDLEDMCEILNLYFNLI